MVLTPSACTAAFPHHATPSPAARRVKQQLAQQLTDKHPQVLEAALAMTPDMVLQVGI